MRLIFIANISECTLISHNLYGISLFTLKFSSRLQRCWWLMLVTVLAFFATNILYLLTLASGTNIQKMSSISNFCHQHPKIVADIKSPTSTGYQNLCWPFVKSYDQPYNSFEFGSAVMFWIDFHTLLMVICS